MKVIRPTLIFLILICGAAAHGQKQLVVLKKEKVLLRLFPGDEFVYRLKGSNTTRTTYVNNISDTAVVTHRDVVPFHRIDRLYFPQRRFYNTVGTALVIFGAGLFVIDQLNVTVVNKKSPDLDPQVTTLTLSSLAVGIPLMVIKRKSQRLKYPVRLMMVEKGSAFYRPDTREQIKVD